MKKLHQYMMILVAGVLSACGSMSVSDPYAEALPADFNAQEYMALHPELRVRQIKDFVADSNSKIKVNLGKDYDATKKADDEAFLANMDVVMAIYTHPQIGGHNAEQWADVIKDLSLPDTSLLYRETRSGLTEFNFIGVADDASLLLTVPVDYQAIAQQFNIYGRDHGWAYRACRPEEAANPPRNSLPIFAQQLNIAEKDGAFIADSGYYCRDALGVDRLIQ
ncbi:hypothetical protein [Fibrobacter sp. UWB12]|jgi:hypothetical protein|uniref:hypothetical protein n=1 Tax=Fibrobacter sp. UWB12 TaxID=1896203 RepID=UPI00091BB460|nr:hypothetical protein [Fibrobacter sp. UWB12]SHK98627.1 hypothetical protein SAMN05720759_11149 [Fibrobacter sp. UWB12]